MFAIGEERKLIDIRNDSGLKLQYFEKVRNAEAELKLKQT